MAQQLLNTSWSLHRLTPLHHGNESRDLIHNPAALKTYADRLRDHLTGGLIGGYPIADAHDSGLSKTGLLKRCSWERLSGWSHSTFRQNPEDGNDYTMGILVVLEYEFMTYKAALLARPVHKEGEGEGPVGRRGGRPRRGAVDEAARSRKQQSTHLPLLLTRLPNALRQSFISFLSASFDTYCTPLHLPSDFLCSGLETYLRAVVAHPLSTSGTFDSVELLENAIKEIHLTLAFSPSVAPALGLLNISIPRENLIRFISLEESDRSEDPTDRVMRGSLLKGLNTYLEKHLAMKVDLMVDSASHSLAKRHVRLAKIACGTFVLGAEGRLKLVLVRPDAAARNEAGRGRKDSDRPILKASEDLLHAVISKAIIGGQ